MYRRMCANSCGRPAVYVRRGRRKARNDHDLCAKCWRAVMNAARVAGRETDGSKHNTGMSTMQLP